MDKNFSTGGRTYAFGTLPATEAIIVEVAIARIIGEPLFKAFTSKDGESEKDAEQIGAVAIGLLFSKMDANELLDTMRRVFAYVSCDGLRVEMDATFTGRNKEMLVVFVQALRFNFQDFFPDALLASIRNKVAQFK